MTFFDPLINCDFTYRANHDRLLGQIKSYCKDNKEQVYNNKLMTDLGLGLGIFLSYFSHHH